MPPLFIGKCKLSKNYILAPKLRENHAIGMLGVKVAGHSLVLQAKSWHHHAYLIMLTSPIFQNYTFAPKRQNIYILTPLGGRPLFTPWRPSFAYLIMMTSSWWHHVLISCLHHQTFQKLHFCPKSENSYKNAP